MGKTYKDDSRNKFEHLKHHKNRKGNKVNLNKSTNVPVTDYLDEFEYSRNLIKKYY